MISSRAKSTEIIENDKDFSGVSSLYKLVILNERIGVTKDSYSEEHVVLYMPEKIGFAVKSNWMNAFDASKDLGKSFSNMNDFLRRGFGTEITDPALTAQVWKSTEPIPFTLPFQIFAFSPNEVKQKLAALIRMAVPTFVNLGAGGVLVAPGPSLASYAAGRLKTLYNSLFGEGEAEKYGQNISITIGKSMYFSSVVITDLAFDVESKFTRDGDFITASGRITFKTFTTPFAAEINEMLGLPSDPKHGLSMQDSVTKNMIRG